MRDILKSPKSELKKRKRNQELKHDFKQAEKTLDEI